MCRQSTCPGCKRSRVPSTVSQKQTHKDQSQSVGISSLPCNRLFNGFTSHRKMNPKNPQAFPILEASSFTVHFLLGPHRTFQFSRGIKSPSFCSSGARTLSSSSSHLLRALLVGLLPESLLRRLPFTPYHSPRLWCYHRTDCS